MILVRYDMRLNIQYETQLKYALNNPFIKVYHIDFPVRIRCFPAGITILPNGTATQMLTSLREDQVLWATAGFHKSSGFAHTGRRQ